MRATSRPRRPSGYESDSTGLWTLKNPKIQEHADDEDYEADEDLQRNESSTRRLPRDHIMRYASAYEGIALRNASALEIIATDVVSTARPDAATPIVKDSSCRLSFEQCWRDDLQERHQQQQSSPRQSSPPPPRGRDSHHRSADDATIVAFAVDARELQQHAVRGSSGDASSDAAF